MVKHLLIWPPMNYDHTIDEAAYEDDVYARVGASTKQHLPDSVYSAIEEWGLDFHTGNIVKYTVKAAKKDNDVAELKKVQWFINRLIALKESKDG